MITPVKYDKYGSSIELKKLMTKGNMNDQVNIKFLNMQGEINTLKEKLSDCMMEIKNVKSRALRIEECEDLRDQQLEVLKTALNKTIAYIERDGYEWKVLDIPEAKK